MTTHHIPARQRGTSGPKIFPIGLGCMSFSGMYGAFDAEAGIDTIHAALDAGVRLLHTGDFYANQCCARQPLCRGTDGASRQ